MHDTESQAMLDALKKAVDIAGSPTKLAQLLGMPSNAHVFVMLNRDKKASPRYVIKINEVTGVPLSELRPDLYPPSVTGENS